MSVRESFAKVMRLVGVQPNSVQSKPNTGWVLGAETIIGSLPEEEGKIMGAQEGFEEVPWVAVPLYFPPQDDVEQTP